MGREKRDVCGEYNNARASNARYFRPRMQSPMLAAADIEL